MGETFAKKALQQKKAKKKQEKRERKEERKTNNDKGKSLEEMMVYLDENGLITDVPPDKQMKKKINAESIRLGAAPMERDKEFTGVYTGTVSLFFTDKGFGFITEEKTRETVFVHCNNLKEAVKQGDKVTFKKEKSPKGWAAVDVDKIK